MPDRSFGCSGDPTAGLLGYRDDEAASQREDGHGNGEPVVLDMSPRSRAKVRDLSDLREGRGSTSHSFYCTPGLGAEVERVLLRLEERGVPGPLRTAPAVYRRLVVDYWETFETPSQVAANLLRPPRRRVRNLDPLRSDAGATRHSLYYLPPFSAESRRVRLALEELGGDQAPRNGWRNSAVWREIIVRWLEGYESAEAAADALADEMLGRAEGSPPPETPA